MNLSQHRTLSGRRVPGIALALLAFSLLFSSLGTGQALQASEERVARTLKLMTWNIRYNNPDDGIHAWVRRRHDLAAYLRSQKPDILCIQEGLHDQVAFLNGELHGYAMRGVGREDGKEQGEYAAVYFSTKRLRTLADSTFWLSPTPAIPGKGWDAALPRIATWVRLLDRATGDTLLVINTHFDHQGATARKESAHLIRRKIGQIAQGSPVVVAGDFNSLDNDSSYLAITAPPPPWPALRDAALISRTGHKGPAVTYTGFQPGSTAKPERVDYVFVSEQVKVVRHVTPEPWGKSGSLSDHLPVAVELIVVPDATRSLGRVIQGMH